MSDLLAREAATLWRLSSYGRERWLPNSGYWWENRGRGRGAVVFQYTIAGRMVLREGTRTIEVPPGHAALFSFADDSAYGLPEACAQPYVCEWVTLTGAGLAEHWRLLRDRFSAVVAVDDDTLTALHRLRQDADQRRAVDPAAVSAAVHAFVLGLFTRLQRERQARQSAVERAVEELLSNPTAAPPLKRLAERYGCSREHLTRVFTERMGLAPGAWLASERLARALLLLRDTSLPVAAVAEQCGYGSTHTLARQIRAATGSAPRALRAHNQAPHPPG